MRSARLFIFLTSLLFCYSSLHVKAQPAIPDFIFYNGTILTLEAGQPIAQALAIQDEKILAVGSNVEILAMQGPETEVFDLEGYTLIPGFVDAHTHIFNDAEGMMGLSLQEAQQLAIKHGITTLGDMYVPDFFLDQMRAFEQEGGLRLRTSLYLVYTDNCGGIIGDWYNQHPPTQEPGELLRIGGVKIFTDGGSCGRAALSVPYPDGGYGDLFHEQSALNDMVAQADNNGYQVVLHAIGDRGVEAAQNAIGFTLQGAPNTRRHRIEHNLIVNPDLLGRYSEINAFVTIFGWYGTCSEQAGTGWWNWADIVGPDHLSWISPNRALLDANPGAHIAWHGDDPWIGPLSPIRELHNLVTREVVNPDGSVCEAPDWLKATAITAEEALKMMTIEAAYALFREEEVGSLKPGKYADLLLLSDNPLSVDPPAINDIEVLMTMIGGQVEYGSFPTAVTELGPLSEGLILSQNRPNPFRQETSIIYQIPAKTRVQLAVYNAFGQRVAVLADEEQAADDYIVQWDGTDSQGKPLPAGVYFYCLETGLGVIKTGNMVLMK